LLSEALLAQKRIFASFSAAQRLLNKMMGSDDANSKLFDVPKERELRIESKTKQKGFPLLFFFFFSFYVLICRER
jgi:hypothetical protein